jgi:uncharacterized protein (DUF1015 family)
MANIFPFKGLRYNKGKVEDLDRVITQPYDKITPAMQSDYYDRDPHNYVRLILGLEEDRYASACKTYKQWVDEGILERSDAPALYPYHQEFEAGGRTYVRKGYIAACEIAEFDEGVVLPHERTLSKPKADRLNLMRTCMVNFEQIFLLYPDEEGEVDRLLSPFTGGEPDIRSTDDYGVTHKVWTVTDPGVIAKVQALMVDKILVIADGHHRYETSLNLRNEMRTKRTDFNGTEAFNYRMMTLVNLFDEGLVVLPTHRLIFDLEDFKTEEFLDKAKEHFHVIKVPKDQLAHELAQKADGHAFGMYDGENTYLLSLRKEESVAKFTPDRSEEYRKLDVTILHSMIIESMLGISKEKIEDHVKYEREIAKAFEKVDSGEFQLVFLMNPTRPDQVKAVAELGERMPQKSTDFYPKLVSGLVLFDIAEGETIG